jgi:3-(3-hydroxy-phenyl)propionate hydroxylase
MQMKFKPRPRFESGFVVSDGLGERDSLPGRLFIQPRVELPGGRQMLLDDAMGRGFRLLVFGVPPGDAIPEIPLPSALGAERFQVVPRDYNFPHPLPAGGEGTLLRDLEGSIEAVLRPYGPCAVLLRPDRYVGAVIPLSDARPVSESMAELTDATRSRGT